jgi:dimethylargininase
MIRGVSPAIVHCELTHLERQPIDFTAAVAQHDQYETVLADCGYDLVCLPAADDLPDCVFIEDTALVLEEIAVITRPGAESRRGEIPAVAAALAAYRSLLHIEAPGTLDGGDVLCLGREIFVGNSARTNQEGVNQLQSLLSAYGYRVHAVPFDGCLHLKSAVTQVGARTLLINPAWVSPAHFPGWDCLAIDPHEPMAANVLLLGETVLAAQAYPYTTVRLLHAGFTLRLLDASELAKAEGGLTCCSLLFEA